MIIEPLCLQKITYSAKMMTATKDGLGIGEGTTSDAAQTPMVHDFPKGTGAMTKIPKSPPTLRLKKDK